MEQVGDWLVAWGAVPQSDESDSVAFHLFRLSIDTSVRYSKTVLGFGLLSMLSDVIEKIAAH